MGWRTLNHFHRTGPQYSGPCGIPREGASMSNMKTLFDLNTIDAQGGNVNTDTIQAVNTAKKNAIEIRNLNFFYGSYQGLNDINLNIEEGKVTAFIGPSGCGKSTLLRSMNRMYDLYPGQREIGRASCRERV